MDEESNYQSGLYQRFEEAAQQKAKADEERDLVYKQNLAMIENREKRRANAKERYKIPLFTKVYKDPVAVMLEKHKLSMIERGLLFTILPHIDKTGVITLLVKDIASRCGYKGIDQVSKMLSSLTDKKWIEKNSDGAYPYRINQEYISCTRGK